MTDGAFLQVRLTPRASKDEVTGWRDDVLQVRLRAPPVEGQANDALRRFIARSLGIPQSDVEIASGATSRIKRLRIHGLDATELRRRLATP